MMIMKDYEEFRLNAYPIIGYLGASLSTLFSTNLFFNLLLFAWCLFLSDILFYSQKILILLKVILLVLIIILGTHTVSSIHSANFLFNFSSALRIMIVIYSGIVVFWKMSMLQMILISKALFFNSNMESALISGYRTFSVFEYSSKKVLLSLKVKGVGVRHFRPMIVLFLSNLLISFFEYISQTISHIENLSTGAFKGQNRIVSLRTLFVVFYLVTSIYGGIYVR